MVSSEAPRGLSRLIPLPATDRCVTEWQAEEGAQPNVREAQRRRSGRAVSLEAVAVLAPGPHKHGPFCQGLGEVLREETLPPGRSQGKLPVYSLDTWLTLTLLLSP